MLDPAVNSGTFPRSILPKASLEELRLDHEDYLRQHKLPIWNRDNPRRVALIDARPASTDDVAAWAVAVKSGQRGLNRHGGKIGDPMSTVYTRSPESTFPEIAANGALALIAVANALLDRQMQAQAAAFEKEGGFTERLYRTRTQA